MATISTLAVEVLQLIVDELDPYGGQKFDSFMKSYWEQVDFRACHLVSKNFRHCALKWLYHSVQIHGWSPERSTALKDLILPPSNSQLGGVGRYIQRVRIIYPSEPSSNDDASDVAASVIKVKEFLSNDSVIAIIKALQDEETSGLRKLFLHMGKRPIKYNDIPQDFQTAFHSLIHFSYLTHLEVSAVHLLPPTLLKGTHLEHFATEDCTLDEDGISTLYNQHSDPLLKTLIMDFSCPLPVDLRCLQKVTFPYYYTKPQHASKCWQLIIDASESLEHLEIRPHPGKLYTNTGHRPSNELSPPESFSLDKIPNIKFFDYSHYHGRTPNSRENNFSALFQLFDVKSPMTRLETVEVFIDLGSISAMDELSSVVEDRWSALDEILTSEKFPCLGRVLFLFLLRTQLRTHTPSWIISDRVKLILEPYFTKLESSDKIDFEVARGVMDEFA